MKNIKIKMVFSDKGSPDGINIFEYSEGKEYDLPIELAECFIQRGTAHEVKIEIKQEIETKIEKKGKNK